MTDKAKQKEQVKIAIRSLLTSAPLGLTLNELRRDYVEYIGIRLPSRDLGYNSDEDFLYSIPDTVQVTYNGNMMVLTAVTNAATENIQRLVSRQKVDPKKKWGVLGKQRLKSQTSRGADKSYWRRGYADSKQAKHRTLPSVPSHVRSKIIELVKDEPDGLPLTHFGTIFRKRVGIPFDPVALGFSTDYDLLSSLGDIVMLKKFGEEIRVIQAGQWQFNHHHQHMHMRDDSQYATSNGPVNKIKTQEKPSLSCLLEKSENYPIVQETKNLSKYNESKGVKSVKGEDKPSSKHTALEQYGNIPKFVQENIQKIMAKRPKGICASRLPFEYKETYNTEFPSKTYGYNSVMEFVSALPHIIRFERPHPQGDWQLYAINGSQPGIASEEKASKCQRNQEILISKSLPSIEAAAACKPPHHQEISDHQESLFDKHHYVQVDMNLKDAVAQVICMHPDGIPLDKFEETFEEMTGMNLDIKRYTNDGIKAFLYSMTDILLLSVNTMEQTVVCPKIVIHPRRFDKLRTQYQPIFPPTEQKKEEVLRLPDDAASPGCYYKAQPLPCADKGKFIGLYVSYVLSPGVFWVQLRGDDTTVALEDLMDELERVYCTKSLSKGYLMPFSLAKKGTLCAVIFPEDGFWHRGIITGHKNDLIEVYYVDYGNSCLVSIDQLRLLKTKFLKLPAQAVRARLGNIKPVGGVWKNNSRVKLLSLTREVPLIALVTNVKDGVLSLCLTDTNGKDKDVHINDVLVEEGYAYMEPDEPVPQLDTHIEAPTMDLLYGADAPKVTQEQQDKSSHCRYIRQAQVTDDCIMHLINLDGSLYLLSFEISSLFFDEDIISSMLKHDNVDVPKVVISKVKHPDLFNELIMYEVPRVTENTNLLSLFPLKVMPLIIGLYGKSEKFKDIKETFMDILDWFSPDDPYWKGENEDETDTSSSLGDTLEMPSLEDLQLVLSTLNIKRKRILSKMTSDVHSSPEYVNELTEVELHINRVEKLISKIESRTHHTTSSSNVSYTVDTFKDLEDQNLAAGAEAKLESKSTQKVAPIVQENLALTSLPTLFPQATVQDITSLLLQQWWMERLSQTVDPSIVQASANPTTLTSQALTSHHLQQLLQQQILQTQLQQQSLSGLANVPVSGSDNSLLQNQQLLQESLLQQQELNARIAELTLGRPATMVNPMNLLLGAASLRLPTFQQTAPVLSAFNWGSAAPLLQQPAPRGLAPGLTAGTQPAPRTAPGLTARALEQSQLFQLQQGLSSQPPTMSAQQAFTRGARGSVRDVTPRTTN